MTKKERVMAAIQGKEVDHVPVGFSLHFPCGEEKGERGVLSHLKFFQETDTDIIKIMNENLVPDVGEIQVPSDWSKIPSYSLKDSFIQKQLDMVKAILEQADKTAFCIGTIHGICASAIHPIESRYGYEKVRDLFCTHIRENKTPVVEAFKRITDIMCQLAVKYKELGVDGIYYAALGGEKHYFTEEEFAEVMEPFDKQILNTAKEAGLINFLHMCKNNLNMERYASYNELADVVNWGVYETDFSLEEGRKLFQGTTVMGGLKNRSGVMVEGTIEELKAEAKQVIKGYGKKSFILGADCTLPTEIPYERIRAIVEAAREL
ncbi:uroporphyrinogen decarboxylase [Anaerocolumna jejuensis DSM 15929]|uniref:Uroporphyrinogen decarboxylase n=1 Tax=Anaerocolumna jejuensis DSM 15929 TaxID=1121322 RepID=A0A1M6SV84_9FIRM|nr:uroporphyrinogen decarboxylase family protein [Anaerocolumna jejuensis]SHK48550.1 uroporphyrinogen decarboxylase [Anaerocolumna jejuensis DSM 15929]